MLRDQMKVAQVGNRCPLEDDWAEMIGKDAGEQRKIRDSNSAGKHCPMLRADHRACVELPWDIQGGRKGHECPNNPHYAHRLEIERMEENEEFLDDCSRLYDLVEMGLYQGNLGPTEIQVVRIMRQYHRSAGVRIG